MLLPNLNATDSVVEPPRYSEDIDSTCSTPFVSAPSSPGHCHGPSGYFFSAPASPMHYLLSNDHQNPKTLSSRYEPVFLSSDSASFEFEFSSRLSPDGYGNGSMTSADELFFNGQIRPMKLSFFGDLDSENAVENVRRRDLRGRSSTKHSSHHRKARSMSPLRTERHGSVNISGNQGCNETESKVPSIEKTPSCSESSSRSSSYGRNSKKWIFLKDLLHRSKSEGRGNNSKERFWSAISFSPAKDKKASPSSALSPSSSRDEKEGGKTEMKKGRRVPVSTGKPANGVWKRRVPPSAHELLYTSNRAQAEEMKKKTFLPYRQGILGCMGFSSKGYGAFSGLITKNLNPISSR